jgi:hypothetical protein
MKENGAAVEAEKRAKSKKLHPSKSQPLNVLAQQGCLLESDDLLNCKIYQLGHVTKIL